MFGKISTKIFGTKHERDLKKLQPIVDSINALEEQMKALDNDALAAKTAEFKKRLEGGESLDDILPEAFAVVREVSVRTMGMRHFDVQLIGGIVLHQGKIAEMKTGEGKTLTSTLPCYLNALSGKGVHMVTVNDYLASRDANWMRPIFEFLGINVGIIQNEMRSAERRRAYACDITYGTNNEFGFDYLRDNMVGEGDGRVQRGFNFAIVDEVDSILVDEARTPLIISGPTDENTDLYHKVNMIMPALKGRTKVEDPVKEKEIREQTDFTNIHYEIDEKSKNVLLTESGIAEVERLMHIDNLYDPRNVDLVHHVHQALKATKVFHKDVDYVVEGGEVVIVDEHTGRKMTGRRYSDGLHQALEAKEGVTIENENQTLATITFQNYFRMYTTLSGMTGTAETEAEEFHKIYELDVVVIPTNLPIARIDNADRVYRTEQEKYNAIAEDIREKHLSGQPVLVGTITIEKSEALSAALKRAGLPHNVLNAKYHLKEAEIVANAGKPGAITIATNMAGRGTDIVLGGAPEYQKDLLELELANEEADAPQEQIRAIVNLLKQKKFDEALAKAPGVEGDAWEKKVREVVERGKIWMASHIKVKESGGLYVLGSERHESRRIDNQLRGRSGRQGDPGETRFYLCFEDSLMRIFGSDRISGIMERLGMTEGQEIEHSMVSRAIERAQKRVEGYNFDHRKYLLEYDDVMNKQREYIYAERNHILNGEDLSDRIRELFELETESIVEMYCQSRNPEDWDMENFLDAWSEIFGFLPDVDALSLDGKDAQVSMYTHCLDAAWAKYQEKTSRIPEQDWKHIERMVFLEVIDGRWKEHLYEMDQLKEGIWTVSYSEKQPLTEYKLQGFRLFHELKERIYSEVVRYIMHVEPVAVDEPVRNSIEEDLYDISADHSELGQFGSIGSQSNMLGIEQGQAKTQAKSKNAPAKSAGGGTKRKKSRKRR
jgi:preprotein translocase subunit SecA